MKAISGSSEAGLELLIRTERHGTGGVILMLVDLRADGSSGPAVVITAGLLRLGIKRRLDTSE